MSDVLRLLVLGADTDREHVLLERVPDDASDHLRGLVVLGVGALLAVAQEWQVGVLDVILLVDEELLEVGVLRPLIVE